jgi:hypothetical protein
MGQFRIPPLGTPEDVARAQAKLAASQTEQPWQNRFHGGIEDAARGLLGPQGYQAVNQLGNFFTAMSPVDDYQFSADGFDKMLAKGATNWERIKGLGQGVLGAATFAAPAVLPPLTPALARGADRVEETAANVQAGLLDTAKARMDGRIGAFDVWHGSPHKFDKFDFSKMGTGEGAQAYGHGGYFGEAKATAESYLDSNSATASLSYDGSPITGELEQSVAWYLSRANGDKAAVTDQWNGMYKPEYWKTVQGKAEKKILNDMDFDKLSSGHLYETRIDAEPEDFLDWDTPLSGQSQAVQDLARSSDISAARGPTLGQMRMFRDGTEQAHSAATGQTLYRAMSDYGGNSVQGSKAIQDAGFPGIRYKDQGSRGADGGTSNYVLFDDAKAEILSRNGQPTLNPAPARQLGDFLDDPSRASPLGKSEALDDAGFTEYLERVNPGGKRIEDADRPNLAMGDMYGMLPKGAVKVSNSGGTTFYKSGDDYYATAYNPDVGEMDVVGYALNRGKDTELHVVQEMQGKGIGGELQFLYRKNNPDALSGGLTEAGEASLKKTFYRMNPPKKTADADPVAAAKTAFYNSPNDPVLRKVWMDARKARDTPTLNPGLLGALNKQGPQ